ncbi:MAG: serine acetyltransferase [Oscillospiraceae bacterium]|nr:serine acetyltransferase [Oscillospiraceae bacterium]
MDDFNDLQNIINSSAQHLASLNSKRVCGSVSRPGMKKKVVRMIDLLRSAMYPAIFPEEHDGRFMGAIISGYLQQASVLLRGMICDIMDGEGPDCADRLVSEFISSIPAISDCLETDIRAAYEGDPAAVSEEEIMLAYPAFEAISIYRLAHCLYLLKVPILPRMMTEYAHTLTGIDIHPGASIGRYFFIDHGTGVVIGETCTIGEHVKLYQGVTLGAKSFELDENGNPVKGIKRHPDIGDHVVIYSGATILGGDTVIGSGCVIGGSVWLTHSLEPGSTVYNNSRL